MREGEEKCEKMNSSSVPILTRKVFEFECAVCGIYSATKESLIQHTMCHEKNVREKTKMYHCQMHECKYKAKHPPLVYRHMQKEHPLFSTEIVGLSCSFVELPPRDFWSRRRRYILEEKKDEAIVIVETAKIYNCLKKKCDFKAKDKYDLYQHILKQHTFLTPTTEQIEIQFPSRDNFNKDTISSGKEIEIDIEKLIDLVFNEKNVRALSLEEMLQPLPENVEDWPENPDDWYKKAITRENRNSIDAQSQSCISGASLDCEFNFNIENVRTLSSSEYKYMRNIEIEYDSDDSDRLIIDEDASSNDDDDEEGDEQQQQQTNEENISFVASVNANYDEKQKKFFKCNLCPIMCLDQFILKEHQWEKHQKNINIKFVCSICCIMYKQKRSLEEHENSIHKNIKPYECNYCSFTTARRFCFSTHVKRRHSNSEKYINLF